ncbi:MAG: YdcF family protein [Alphaproteobacteria bacterium]|nr:YdcF family protein [Alphaproteobacteria bacterium]
MTFFLSKFLWIFVEPGSLCAILLAVGLVLAASSHPARRAWGRRLAVGVACFYLAVAILPVGEWALVPLENRFAAQVLPGHVAGVIVIGGDEKPKIAAARNTPFVALDSMRRYAEFALLARRYPDARLVFSGGSPELRPGAKIVDADVARANLAAMGVPVGRMVFEEKSRNTFENAQFTAAIVHPEPGQVWILVTSAWHMPRAIGCFRRAGFDIVAAPTGYFTDGHFDRSPAFRFDEQMHMLTMAMHEYIGLAAYRLMGRIDALWPGTT